MLLFQQLVTIVFILIFDFYRS